MFLTLNRTSVDHVYDNLWGFLTSTFWFTQTLRLKIMVCLVFHNSWLAWHGRPSGTKNTTASGPKLYPAFRGHMNMYHPMRYENAACSISGALVPWDTSMSTYFWRVPLRTLPRAKIGAAWGPKLFFIFRGHMDLYHHVVKDNVTFFLFRAPRPWNIAKSANMLTGTT